MDFESLIHMLDFVGFKFGEDCGGYENSSVLIGNRFFCKVYKPPVVCEVVKAKAISANTTTGLFYHKLN